MKEKKRKSRKKKIKKILPNNTTQYNIQSFPSKYSFNIFRCYDI